MPSFQRLTVTWIILLALTVVTGAASALAGQSGFVAGATLVLGLSSLLKARLIIADYLELRGAPQWQSVFTGILIALAATVYGLALFRLLMLP